MTINIMILISGSSRGHKRRQSSSESSVDDDKFCRGNDLEKLLL